ncbi:MAG: HNH endonuclease, partial [Butyrivibrio sp.]|nr:HNH endonuclease [Butyrivibrio sp.]
DAVLEVKQIVDVFTDEAIDPKGYDVDHFIPWSFVMNDELWNLMPMESALNSSKSNKLPAWDPFFIRFSQNQYLLYQLIHDEDYPGMHKRFEACYKDNIHSIWANQELYRPGNTPEEFGNILEKNMRPVYDSARRQGYELWKI